MDNHIGYVPLTNVHGVWRKRLPDALCESDETFEKLWQLHPETFPRIFLHGRQVALPRWQQAYGQDYSFSGQTSRAQPVPDLLKPYLDWAIKCVDTRLNGMLLNWYDGKRGHYIGAHRDSRQGLIAEACIVMMSLGEQRLLRFRPVGRSGFTDLIVDNGDVVVMSSIVNQHFKHEVPTFKRYQGRRISITLRGFDIHKAVKR